MEMEANSPHIVMSDAGLEDVASATVSSGCANSGQARTSTQGVLAGRRIHADFPDAPAAPARAYDAKGRMSTV